jgi:hypothetical protein
MGFLLYNNGRGFLILHSDIAIRLLVEEGLGGAGTKCLSHMRHTGDHAISTDCCAIVVVLGKG